MNEEYTKIKITKPLITLDETIALDNHINEIVKEISELQLHDKDLALAQEIIKRLRQRIDKAIEYIEKKEEKRDYSDEPIYYLDEDEIKQLLEILRGDNNEK